MKWNKKLRALNSKIKNHHLIIVVVWISFTVLAFAYFAQERLVIFDVNNKLQGVDHLQLAHYFQDYSSSESRGLGNKVIHFSKPNCACQKFSRCAAEETDSGVGPQTVIRLMHCLPMD